MSRRSISFLLLALPFVTLFAACSRTEAKRTPVATAVQAPTAVAAPSATLEEGKQKYIWEIEHKSFELETKFGKAFLAALRKRDVEALGNFLRPGCAGVVLDPSQRVVVDRSYLRESSSPAERGRQSAVDASGLARYLCGYFDGFKLITGSKFRVLALDADDRRPESGRWTIQLLLSGAGIDPAGGRMEFTSEHRVDCEFSNDAEIAAGRIVRSWSVLKEKNRWGPAPLFEEITAAVGLDQVDIPDNWNGPTEAVRQYHTQMAVEDYDRDGFLDIAVASANGRWRLLGSVAGKKFVEVTDRVGLPQWSDELPRSKSVRDQIYLATWIDFDNDGFPDLLLGDRLFHNLRGKRFEDVTQSSDLVFSSNPRGCAVADYDCDGLLDLYVLYQHPLGRPLEGTAGWVGDSESGAENQLWKNVGKGQFVNVTQQAQAGGGRRQSFAAAWLFANHDQYPDLYIANDFGENVLLLNQGDGRFQDVSKATGVADYATSMGVAAGDLTGDGEPEIYVANMFSKMGRRIIAHVGPEDYPPGVFEQIKGSCAGNSFYTRATPEAKYQEQSEAFDVNQVGWAYAPALADFDSDGFLDIYATAGFLSFQRSKPDG